MDQNSIATGGDVEISKLVLTNFKGNTLDISLIFTEVEIYEDVYSASLSGSITIVDTRDLIHEFPIIGEETLQMTFKTPGLPNAAEVSQTFVIYKLTNFIVSSPHKQLYTLHFVTPETMTDLSRRISKAFQGSPDSIIKRILGADGLSTKKKFEIEPSSNNIKFVSPFWTPFKCINYLVSRAQTVDTFKSSNFLFFETNKGYKFKSVNSIFDSKNKPFIEYKYNNDPSRDPRDGESVRDVSAELTKIFSLALDCRFDMIDRIESGFYSHQMWDHNLLLKTLTKRTYIYNDDFKKTNHLSDNTISSNKLQVSKQTAISTVTTYPQVHNDVKEDNYGKILTNKIPLLAQLNAFKLDITVHGRTDLQVGDLVNLNIGGMEIISQDSKRKVLDNTYNGRYFVVSILHRITIKKHQMIVQVVKESVKEKYA
jgi:hypothetical protein